MGFSMWLAHLFCGGGEEGVTVLMQKQVMWELLQLCDILYKRNVTLSFYFSLFDQRSAVVVLWLCQVICFFVAGF